MAFTETGNNDIRKLIAWGLRRMRSIEKKHLDDTAKWLEISPKQMLKYETGEDAITGEQLYRLVIDGYDMSFEEFFAHLPELYYP
jgi:hypothetical protein